ncbi:hypothetical protein [Spirosoma utsteinense]|uniref:Outer membrane protein beta-barrel domain-containing protein n=1 Tax=Spirosoma utsteinense TaxID=2585773 RepID=A0ABR6W1I6_9BACT|nr:hypothetical protein [Spirosoma utsteinense]MBC3783772.1 hypothetical protein [Spirosoma utsteinense]MBC3790084.1 hypothetical protein [Spirosoma utsteinense]
MHSKPIRLWLSGALLAASVSLAAAQGGRQPFQQPDERQPEIYFPQAPRPGEWRKSLGLIFTTTPPELTEEVRVSVPAVDFNLQKGLSKKLFLTGRLQTQFVQSNLGLGLRWATPLSDRLFLSVGDDMTGWFGALLIKDVFNSQAYGLQNFPNLSLGYRLNRDLQLTVRGEGILDMYYRSKVGTLAVVDNKWQVNGFAVSFVLEQPFYGNQHVSLGFRAAYSNFNWQFWSLYDTFDRNLFYPQVIFGFIL